MRLKPLGDAAWLVEFRGAAALAQVTSLATALANGRPAGVLDVVPSFASLAVYFDSADGLKIRLWIEAAMASAPVAARQPPPPEVRQIPVCYGGEHGPDLEELAKTVGLSAEEVIARHSGATYTVAAVGFSPGFPYLLGLPECLQVPRRATPRLVVPAGSVAVAGSQAGIYPFTSPGGWHVLGRTNVTLFDPLKECPALLRPGDRLRFVPVKNWQAPKILPSIAEPASARCIEVIHPGALTTVQDLGRPGYGSSGVSPGGAADRHALRRANLLVGNDEGAAALELCVRGPVLKLHASAIVALSADTAKSQRVAAGETLDFSQLRGGVRAYLAVAGGLCVPSMLGSAATDLRAHFGGFCGRPLQVGDRLDFGSPGQIPRCGDWHAGRPGPTAEIELRFLRGVQQSWFSEEARRRFRTTAYQLTPRSDRMGARLAGPPLHLTRPREMFSQPVACGSVQVPQDGQPIVLLAERQTIGGYPQIGHVISVDLPLLARAWPGTTVRFREVTWQEAQRLRQQNERHFGWLHLGLGPSMMSQCEPSI